MRLLMTVILGGLFLQGCQSLPEYNPVSSVTRGDYTLNQKGFNQLANGMTMEQVHALMGDGILAGYSLDPQSTTYSSQHIPNPYKAEIVKTAQSSFIVEYYVARIDRPDGDISDNELLPLIFKDGVLIDRGWDALKHLKSIQ